MTKTQYQQIREHVIEAQHVSTASLMIKFKLRVDRAIEMLDQLETDGVVSAEDSTGQRVVLIGGEE